jgi:hypothetical protein
MCQSKYGPNMVTEVIPLGGRRNRGGRRKGEKRVAVLGNRQLFELFECNDLDTLLVKLSAFDIRAHVNGYGDNRAAFVSDYQLPEAMRERARETASRDDGWLGFFDRKG